MKLQPEEAWLIQADGTDIRVSTGSLSVGSILTCKARRKNSRRRKSDKRRDFC